MSPRDRSPVKTLSPGRPPGKTSPQHKLLVHLARGELSPQLSLVSPKFFFFILSPMEFWFLAAVDSGLLSLGLLISCDIVDLIAQILLELNRAGWWHHWIQRWTAINWKLSVYYCTFALPTHYFPIWYCKAALTQYVLLYMYCAI